MAEATLTHQATGVTILSKTNEAGIVLFPGLTPGVYTLKITAVGFRTYQVRDIAITANERRTLGTITLQLGQVQESVDVAAGARPVQTASSERSGLIAGDQILNIASKGRGFLGLMSTLPGVIDSNVGSRELVAHAAAADPRLRRPHGIAYTFSKVLGVGASDFNGVSPYFSMRARYYRLLSYDATHALVINHTY